MTDSDSHPLGFQPYEMGRDTFRRGIELLVPTQLKAQLIEDEKRRRAEEEAQEAEARQARLDASEATWAENRPATATNVALTKTQEALDKEELAWRLIDATDRELLTPATYPVFQSAQALAFFKQQGRGGDSDDKERISKLLRMHANKQEMIEEIKAGDRLEVWRVPNSNLVMAHDTFVIAKEEKNFSGGGGLKKIIFSQNQYWSDFWFQRV